MTTVETNLRGALQACEGWALAHSFGRHVRISDVALTNHGPLLIDDPGNPAPLFLRTFAANVRNSRIQATTGVQVINPLTTFTAAAVHGGGTALLPAFTQVELAGLGGDFAIANGLHMCQMADWVMPIGGSAYYSLAAIVDTTRLILAWSSFVGGFWGVGLNLQPGCWKIWYSEMAPMEDCEGVYSEHYHWEPLGPIRCDSAGCPDPTTCAISAGATCRVRWAGATWP